jgi:hypothetical protein
MSRYLNRYEFGHLPLEAQVLQTRESGSQTFHVVKIHFPRGDAACGAACKSRPPEGVIGLQKSAIS